MTAQQFAGSRPPTTTSPMRQMPLDLGPGMAQGLDDFLEGGDRRNVELMSWLRAWPQVQAPVSPAYIWGPAGVGKTHLLRAMVERALSMGFGAIWLNAQTCQMWDAPDPAAPTLAVIDECERLPDDHQHLAFNLFIQSASASSAVSTGGDINGSLFIMAAGSTPAVDLPIRDDLRTRLGWGLSFALAPLDEAGLRTVLQNEAARRGMAVLSDELLGYLLTRYSRDLGFLMGLLHRLDRFALAEHRHLTVPLLKQMLALETA